jgi:hypothetical protein
MSTPDQYVLFSSKFEVGKIYINPPEHSLKKLKELGTVLKNPDLSKVRHLSQADWRLKRGKIQPKFKNPVKLSLNAVNFLLLASLLAIKLYEYYERGFFE